MFTNENPKVSHLKLFECHVYLHVPKKKISKLDPSRRMRIFVGYNHQSKDYRIYIPHFCYIEISRDVTFDEDAYFTKYRKNFSDEGYEEEQEAPRTIEATRPPVRDVKEDPIPEYHEME